MSTTTTPILINPLRFKRLHKILPCAWDHGYMTLSAVTDPDDSDYLMFDFKPSKRFPVPADVWEKVPPEWKWVRDARYWKPALRLFKWWRSYDKMLDPIPRVVEIPPGQLSAQETSHFLSYHQIRVTTKQGGDGDVIFAGIYDTEIEISVEDEMQMWERSYSSLPKKERQKVEDLNLPFAIPPDFTKVQSIQMKGWNSEEGTSFDFHYLPGTNGEGKPSFTCIRECSMRRNRPAHLSHADLRRLLWVRVSPNVFEYEDRGVKLIATTKCGLPYSDSTYNGGIWF